MVPAATLSKSRTLPSGITFNAATGVVSGSPAAGTAGTYDLTFTASNGIGLSATQDFMLTVNYGPATTSAATRDSLLELPVTSTASAGRFRRLHLATCQRAGCHWTH